MNNKQSNNISSSTISSNVTRASNASRTEAHSSLPRIMRRNSDGTVSISNSQTSVPSISCREMLQNIHDDMCNDFLN